MCCINNIVCAAQDFGCIIDAVRRFHDIRSNFYNACYLSNAANKRNEQTAAAFVEVARGATENADRTVGG